jgi:hypothetical protein
MKKPLLLFYFTCCILHFSIAQNPLVKQWDKRFGGHQYEHLTCFNQTVDGGFILGGYSLSDSSGDKTQPRWDILLGNADFWIVKIDSIGNKEWDKDFGTTKDDRLYSVDQTSDGGYVLGGQTSSGISGDKTQPNWDPAQISTEIGNW